MDGTTAVVGDDGIVTSAAPESVRSGPETRVAGPEKPKYVVNVSPKASDVDNEGLFEGLIRPSLKDAFPSIRKLGVLLDSKFPIQQELGVITDAAARLGIELLLGEASSGDQYFDAVARLRAAGVDAYDVVYTGSSFAIRRELAGVILGTRLPAIYGVSRFADDGGLIAYSWRTLNVAVLAAEYANRILRGTSPADLPVQEPTTIELVVNLATAREQRLTIPQSILRRADRIIE